MNLETIKQQLKQVRLSHASREIDEVVEKHKKAVNIGWVTDLLEREIDARKENTIRLRIKKAGFPELTSLENFDWAFNPEIDEAKIRELAELKFIEDNQIALFLGTPGAGKTHIALAIGVIAAQRGYSVYWASAKKLSNQILLHRRRNTMDQFFKKVLSAKLWIIDDWGVISMEREVAEEVFDLLDRRKYQSAMILTSNRDVGEWGEVFPDPVIANATVDRIFDRAKVVLFKGPSYRLKGRIKNREREIDKEAKQT
jgi:DNA replication protein DnaC